MADPVRIRLCPAIAVDLDGRTVKGRELGSRKARTLLALLAAERGRLVPMDRIVAVLWPDDPPADPAANVSTLVSRTRRLLGDALTSAPGRAYGLVGAGAWSVDLDEAGGLLDEADDRLSSGEHGLGAAASRRALDLLGAEHALLDEPDADWVERVRREADALRARGRRLLATALTVVDPPEAVRVASEAVEGDPFDERASRALMRAQVAAGRTAAALSTYDSLAGRLRDELGTDPDRVPRYDGLHLSVLRDADQDDDPATTPSPTRGTPAPALIGRRGRAGAGLDRAWAAAGARTGGCCSSRARPGSARPACWTPPPSWPPRRAGRCCARGAIRRSGRCSSSLRRRAPPGAARRAAGHGGPAGAGPRRRVGRAAARGGPAGRRDGVRRSPGRPPDLQRRRGYDAVAAVLRRLAAERAPVLLAVDDLQDGGAATVDLLGYLAERLRDTRRAGGRRRSAPRTRAPSCSPTGPRSCGSLRCRGRR